jgi:N-acetylmuramoyl-L-alanine amidase
MKVLKSPNFDDRSGAGIKYLILHYTGMATGAEALERLCDPQAKVSAHYLVEEDGEIYKLVDEDKRAWHAGVSKWEEDDTINDLSIGIEIVNSGHAYPGYESIYRDFPEAQMAAVISLAQKIIDRHDIKPCYVLGHSDVAWRRKIDPGELFDWEKLSKNGVGCWPVDSSEQMDIKVDLDELLRNLQAYGYDIADCKNNPSEIITAFQRHFRQDNIDGKLDAETMQRLGSLLEQKLS